VSTTGDRDGVWALIILGALLAVTALFSLAMPAVVATEWFAVLFGVLLFVAPWVLTYTDRTTASWTSWMWERSRRCSAAARCQWVAGRVARRSSTSAEALVAGVAVTPGEIAADHAGLLAVGGVVGAVEGEVAQRGELGLDPVQPARIGRGVGRSPPTTLRRAATGLAGPLPARVRLEVEGAELVHADDHLGIAGLDIVGAVHQPVQVQDPVLPDFEVRVAGLLPGLDHLKRDALGWSRTRRPSWLMSSTTPSVTRKWASLANDQVANGRS
jgi:hypothetical protein